MKILAIHNFHRKGSASGDDQVFKSETALLEEHGNQVIRYTVSNDEFDDAGVIGKLSATFGMLWSFKNYRNVRQLIEKEKPDIVHVHTFSHYCLRQSFMLQKKVALKLWQHYMILVLYVRVQLLYEEQNYVMSVAMESTIVCVSMVVLKILNCRVLL